MAHPLSLRNNSASILTLPEELSRMIMSLWIKNEVTSKQRNQAKFLWSSDCKINVGVEKEEHDL